MGLFPKASRNLQHSDPLLLPPSFLISCLVQFTVVTAAERDGELITDLEPNRARLRETQMVWIGWATTADKAGLRSNEFQVSLIAYPFWLSDRE